MTNQENRRDESGVIQPVTATQPSISLERSQRRDDPPLASAETPQAPEHSNEIQEARIKLAESATRFEQGWQDCPYVTPRQASAIATGLALWSANIGDWLQGGSVQPLHEIGPFTSIDRRAMIYVNDNKAWAAKAQERCDALCEEVERGVLPLEQHGCFFDELLIGAVLPEAETILAVLPEVFDVIPARATRGDQDENVLQVSDDDWDAVSSTLLDSCRWHASQVPLYRNHPLLAATLADMHPFEWFDPPEDADAGYTWAADSSGVIADEDQAAISSED